MAKAKSAQNIKEETLEKQLWKAADKLRKNIDAAEYKHVVLGLIFLKYISDSFEELSPSCKRDKATMPARTRRTRTSTKPKTFSSCRPRPAGRFFSPKPSSRKSASSSTPRWMPSKRKTRH
ncbi:MAG: type I restriction-modification system subunit M N-terminal domain-containing protein [Methylobacter sp.]